MLRPIDGSSACDGMTSSNGIGDVLSGGSIRMILFLPTSRWAWPSALRECARDAAAKARRNAQCRMQHCRASSSIVIAVSPGPIDGEIWMGLNVDVKGTIYEGLLERNAGEVKSGAGQYFTPRPLIDAIVYVIDPEPTETIHDPAVGTGGFLLSACDHMRKKPAANRKFATRRREDRLSSKDIVAEVVRLCAIRVS